MAQYLQVSPKWEELAEDPFRGLRAGPADFSPLLFLPALTSTVVYPKTAQTVNGEWELGAHAPKRMRKQKLAAILEGRNQESARCKGRSFNWLRLGSGCRVE